MWSKVSPFIQYDANNETSQLLSNDDFKAKEEFTKIPSQGPGPQKDAEWWTKFNFSLGLGDILYSWGFLRHKPSVHKESHSKMMNSPYETIELDSFSNKSAASWKTCPHQTAPSVAQAVNMSSNFKTIQPISSLHDSSSVKWCLETVGTGSGHDFLTSDTHYPMWCDVCGDQLWGLHGQYLRCKIFALSWFITLWWYPMFLTAIVKRIENHLKISPVVDYLLWHQPGVSTLIL